MKLVLIIAKIKKILIQIISRLNIFVQFLIWNTRFRIPGMLPPSEKKKKRLLGDILKEENTSF
ncbi:hypothetical protein BpHYR1_048108 [Brachionus plicatilis]|uniref:Uncharacterized protein n=1 Tax=Brachionus plicatilis TaxID=10195 RepID=A0A3M7R6M2_BRAPC|nr:hypothetical protein BpHYR1_048108 [Brachionus plicatilis]